MRQADLEFFHVTLPDGRQVPLTAVAEVTPARSWSRVARFDGLRPHTVTAAVPASLLRDGDNTLTIETEASEKIQGATNDYTITTDDDSVTLVSDGSHLHIM